MPSTEICNVAHFIQSRRKQYSVFKITQNKLNDPEEGYHRMILGYTLSVG